MIGGPNLRYVRVEPPLARCTGATAVTQSPILFSPGLHVQSGLRNSGTLIYILSTFLLSSNPPDGPSSGTESNLPVSHPAPGILIVNYLLLTFSENDPERLAFDVGLLTYT